MAESMLRMKGRCSKSGLFEFMNEIMKEVGGLLNMFDVLPPTHKAGN